MGERGSAPEPPVIRIFAYPGYKGAYTGGFSARSRSLLVSVSQWRSLRVGSWFLSVCVELVELGELMDRELVELGELVDMELVELVELVELGELVDRELVKLVDSATLVDACREVAPFLFPWGFE